MAQRRPLPIHTRITLDEFLAFTGSLPEKYFHGGGFQYFIWEPQRYLTLA